MFRTGPFFWGRVISNYLSGSSLEMGIGWAALRVLFFLGFNDFFLNDLMKIAPASFLL